MQEQQLGEQQQQNSRGRFYGIEYEFVVDAAKGFTGGRCVCGGRLFSGVQFFPDDFDYDDDFAVAAGVEPAAYAERADDAGDGDCDSDCRDDDRASVRRVEL
jgi:hypothetical protein